MKKLAIPAAVAIIICIVIAIFVSGASAPEVKIDSTAPRVLVVINENSPESIEIGNYYAKKRSIPDVLICRLKCPVREHIALSEYKDQIRDPLRRYLSRNNLKSSIDYIVLTKGVPIRGDGNDERYSVDSMLTLLWKDDIHLRQDNPYFESKKHFSYKDLGFYLVTRLDGYTVADVKGLIDRALIAKPQKGLFLFDTDAARIGQEGYSWLNDLQEIAVKLLEEKKLTCKAVSDTFPGGEKGLMGYYTWGSNHRKFDSAKYIGNSFHPGAVAETIVSTSARTFNPTTGGQTLIADLIHTGVTGVKGYAAEPYAFSMAQPQILFDRYTSGYNLAESYYAASPFVHWMDIIVGDPLCSPWGRNQD